MAIDQTTKILIILQAGTDSHEGSARALHAGLAYEVWDYCAGAFDVREDLTDAGEALSGAYVDHPSIATHVADGSQVWIL